ncbi:MAG: hypothetical protein GY719_29180 [bacterium]|nr:hypothetical protein [bacterium]
MAARAIAHFYGPIRMSEHDPEKLDAGGGKQPPQLVDGFNNPLSPPRRSSVIQRIRSFGSKGPAFATFLIAITVLLLNLGNLIDRFSATEETAFEVPVRVSNSTESDIEVRPLLDYHLVRTPFHTGRLTAGELPTGRIRLETTGASDRKDGHVIAPGDAREYVAVLRAGPYESRLTSGGSNIVFVLHIRDSDGVLFIELPFEAGELSSKRLDFDLRQAE